MVLWPIKNRCERSGITATSSSPNIVFDIAVSLASDEAMGKSFSSVQVSDGPEIGACKAAGVEGDVGTALGSLDVLDVGFDALSDEGGIEM